MAPPKISRPPSGRLREGKKRPPSSHSIAYTAEAAHEIWSDQNSGNCLTDSGVCEKNVHPHVEVFKRRPPDAPNLNVVVPQRRAERAAKKTFILVGGSRLSCTNIELGGRGAHVKNLTHFKQMNVFFANTGPPVRVISAPSRPTRASCGLDHGLWARPR